MCSASLLYLISLLKIIWTSQHKVVADKNMATGSAPDICDSNSLSVGLSKWINNDSVVLIVSLVSLVSGLWIVCMME